MKNIRTITALVLCLAVILSGCGAFESSPGQDEPLILKEKDEEQAGSGEMTDPYIIIKEEKEETYGNETGAEEEKAE